MHLCCWSIEPPTLPSEVAAVFAHYPASVSPQLLALRGLVFEVGAENPEIGTIEETLKWGEPAYLAAGGSTIRMGAKASDPNHYLLFFHCQTTLIDTFKQLYPEDFCFEGNRAIKFHKDDVVAIDKVKQCILMALTYHNCKHLPLLGR